MATNEQNQAEQDVHDLPPTDGTGHPHMLDRDCWCEPLVSGRTVIHRANRGG
jgi:hypothetical protein